MYREFIYARGGVDTGKGKILDVVPLPEQRGTLHSTHPLFYRCRNHRIRSEIMLRMSPREFHRAGREFVRQGFEIFRDAIQPKRERKPHRIKGLEQIYSLKRLS